MLVRGKLAGLALSPDGTTLAYWRLGSAAPAYTLSVFSIAADRAIRQWTLPTHFAADQYGHELAFSSDGASVLARTYDEQALTPLKQFAIASGSVRTVWPDCSGLAAGLGNTYFAGQDQGTPTLFALREHDPVPRKVTAPFHFDSLLSSGTRRWIVAENNRRSQVAVLDPETRSVTQLSATCQHATVTSRDEVLCSVAGTLVSVAGR